MRGLFTLAFLIAAGCGTDTFTSGDSGGSGNDGSVSTEASTTDGTATIGAPGCADGTREIFQDRMAYPHIAGCSGGWSVPGTVGMASLTTPCNRMNGNNSSNPNGTNCSVEDLCQSGWHMCRNAADVRANLPTVATTCAPPENSPGGFWATRQTSDGNAMCTNLDSSNNVVGCANIPGRTAPASCSPLTHMMTSIECNTPPWSCNAMMPDTEAATVTKGGPFTGGVMCCVGP